MSGEERARSGRGVSTSQGAPPGRAPCKSPRTHTSRSPGAGRAGEGDTEAGCREAGTNKGPGTVHQVRGSTSDTLQTQNGSGQALSQVTLSVEAAAAAAAAAAAIQHDLDQIQRSGAQSSGKSVRDESEGHWHGGHGDQQPQPPLQQQRALGVTSAHASAGAAISGGGVQAGGAAANFKRLKVEATSKRALLDHKLAGETSERARQALLWDSETGKQVSVMQSMFAAIAVDGTGVRGQAKHPIFNRSKQPFKVPVLNTIVGARRPARNFEELTLLGWDSSSQRALVLHDDGKLRKVGCARLRPCLSAPAPVPGPPPGPRPPGPRLLCIT